LVQISSTPTSQSKDSAIKGHNGGKVIWQHWKNNIDINVDISITIACHSHCHFGKSIEMRWISSDPMDGPTPRLYRE